MRNEIPLVNCIGSFLVTLGATNGRCNVGGMGMLSQKESLKACRFVSGLRKQRLAEPSNSLQLFQKALMARCLDGKEKIGTYRMWWMYRTWPISIFAVLLGPFLTWHFEGRLASTHPLPGTCFDGPTNVSYSSAAVMKTWATSSTRIDLDGPRWTSEPLGALGSPWGSPREGSWLWLFRMGPVGWVAWLSPSKSRNHGLLWIGECLRSYAWRCDCETWPAVPSSRTCWNGSWLVVEFYLVLVCNKFEEPKSWPSQQSLFFSQVSWRHESDWCLESTNWNHQPEYFSEDWSSIVWLPERARFFAIWAKNATLAHRILADPILNSGALCSVSSSTIFDNSNVWLTCGLWMTLVIRLFFPVRCQFNSVIGRKSICPALNL